GKGIPSWLGVLLDLSPRSLESVLYFSHYIVTSVDEEARQEAIRRLKENRLQEVAERQGALEAKITEMEQERATVEEVNQLRRNWAEEKAQLEEQLSIEVAQLKDLRQRTLLTENQYSELKEKHGHIFEAGMGAEAILQIIKG
ncbi:unnamed protein product, partial [marine sediment metagenome]